MSSEGGDNRVVAAVVTNVSNGGPNVAVERIALHLRTRELRIENLGLILAILSGILRGFRLSSQALLQGSALHSATKASFLILIIY